MSVIVNSVTMVPIASVTVERSGADEIWRRFVRYDGERCGADDVPVGVSRVKSTADGDLVVVDTVGAVLVRTGGVFGAGAAVASDAEGRAVLAAPSNPELAVVDGAAANNDIAVAGIQETDTLIAVSATDGTAVTAPTIHDDAVVRSTADLTGKKLIVVWRGPEHPVAGRALQASTEEDATIAILLGGAAGLH